MMKGICLACGEHVAGLWDLSTLSDFFWGQMSKCSFTPRRALMTIPLPQNGPTYVYLSETMSLLLLTESR